MPPGESTTPLEGALKAALDAPDAASEFERFQVDLLATDDAVRSGPFAGMRLLGEESWGHVANYLLGAYECELHDVLESLLTTPYETIVDVGCAEGYYAVGLAMRAPDAQVHAFDIDDEAREICGRMAEANGVGDRVTVGGTCGPAALEALIRGRTLVFVDCEGYEVELLDPTLAPALRAADLVVELHDFVDPTITTTIVERFSSSHEVELVDSSPRDAADYPDLLDAPPAVKLLALMEVRPIEPHPMQWAVCRSRDAASGGRS